MQAEVKTRSNLIIKIEAETQKDLFKAIASATEVFSERKCGICGCEEIIPIWRTVTQVKGKKTETFEYPEWACTNPKCRAKLSLGCAMEGGTLFPNRKLLEDGKPATGEDREKGRYTNSNGWTLYRGEVKKETPEA